MTEQQQHDLGSGQAQRPELPPTQGTFLWEQVCNAIAGSEQFRRDGNALAWRDAAEVAVTHVLDSLGQGFGEEASSELAPQGRSEDYLQGRRDMLREAAEQMHTLAALFQHTARQEAIPPEER